MFRTLGILIALTLTVGLGACKDETSMRLDITKSLIQVDSQLPDVPPVSPVVLKRVVFDLPRDTAQKMIRKTAECKARTDVTTPDFIVKCTYYPVIRNSNLFVGLDQQNFKNLNANIDALIAANQAKDQRIAEVNRQRALIRGEAPATVSNVATQ